MDQSEVLWEDITNISVDESIFINDKLKNFISVNKLSYLFVSRYDMNTLRDSLNLLL